jgi:hypothetical protein
VYQFELFQVFQQVGSINLGLPIMDGVWALQRE